MSDELKPCPFCGSVVEIVYADQQSSHRERVWCPKCGPVGRIALSAKRDELIAWWNSRRAEPRTVEKAMTAIHNTTMPGPNTAMLRQLIDVLFEWRRTGFVMMDDVDRVIELVERLPDDFTVHVEEEIRKATQQ